MAQILTSENDIKQKQNLENDTDRTVSSDSESELDEGTLAVCDNSNARRNIDNIWSKLLYLCSWWYLSCCWS
jgi:hypothetical protein